MKILTPYLYQEEELFIDNYSRNIVTEADKK